MSFKDHFSGHADAYERFRPVYPEALFDFLARLAPRRELAWDCGTGNGQAARALAGYFVGVIATDASAEQIALAHGPANIRFSVVPAEDSGIAAGSVDLVTVAQAFHWFDQARFFAEVQRVLRPGGIVCLWSYGRMTIAPKVDLVITRFYRETVGPYWPAERAQVEAGYAYARLPFTELPPPAFTMAADWTLDEVLGYLQTWSATQRYIRERGENPLEPLRETLGPAWGESSRRRRVRWPLSLRIGRKEVAP
jgi:SAM-dependent methyltransferase